MKHMKRILAVLMALFMLMNGVVFVCNKGNPWLCQGGGKAFSEGRSG